MWGASPTFLPRRFAPRGICKLRRASARVNGGGAERREDDAELPSLVAGAVRVEALVVTTRTQGTRCDVPDARGARMIGDQRAEIHCRGLACRATSELR